MKLRIELSHGQYIEAAEDLPASQVVEIGDLYREAPPEGVITFEFTGETHFIQKAHIVQIVVS